MCICSEKGLMHLVQNERDRQTQTETEIINRATESKKANETHKIKRSFADPPPPMNFRSPHHLSPIIPAWGGIWETSSTPLRETPTQARKEWNNNDRTGARGSWTPDVDSDREIVTGPVIQQLKGNCWRICPRAKGLRAVIGRPSWPLNGL